MSRFTSFAALVALTICAIPFAPRASAAEQPALAVTQDGADHVVKMNVTANNSLHVLWTRVIRSGDTATLQYYVIHTAPMN